MFRKILSAGILLNPFKLRDLVNAVDKAFITDGNNFSLLEFAEQMSNLTAGNIRGASIPVVNPDATIDGESAVEVNPETVRRYVRAQFGGQRHPGAGRRPGRQRPAAQPSCVY